MDTRKPKPIPSWDFWQKAFVAATAPILLKHDGEQLSPSGAAHLCADFADAAVAELNRRRQS